RPSGWRSPSPARAPRATRSTSSSSARAATTSTSRSSRPGAWPRRACPAASTTGSCPTSAATPEIISPVPAPAALHKAARALALKPVPRAVDPVSFRAAVAAIRDAITPNTILLTASAASYAHGVVDPIEEIGQLALERGLLLHVDGCIGGFLLPYFRRLGARAPAFDPSVPGVTSAAIALHNYAYAPPGASVSVYPDRALRRHQ